MTRPPIKIEVANLKGLKGLFRRVRDFGADPDEVLGMWGALLEASTRTRFDTGTDPGGMPWPKSKRAIRQGGKTLVDKGNLEGSIRWVTRPGELEIGVDGMGQSAKFAHVHQFGYRGQQLVHSYPRTVTEAFGVPLPAPRETIVSSHLRNMNIPRRAFLGVSDDDKRDLREVAIIHLRNIING